MSEQPDHLYHRNSSFDVLRIVACLAVIAIHTFSPALNNYTVGSSSWWAVNLINGFSRWAVPVFIMLSGYLLLDRPYNLPKRLVRVGVPLLIWSAAYLLIDHLFYHQLTVRDVAQKMFDANPHYHLYFLFIMFGLALVTPLLNTLIEFLNRKQLGQVILILFVLSVLHKAACMFWPQFVSEPNAITYFIRFLPYYLLGYFVRDWRVRAPLLILGFLAAVLSAVILNDIAYVHWNRIPYAYAYLNPLIIISAICVFLFALQVHSFTAPTWVRHMSDCTLGIYLIHPLLLGIGLGIVPLVPLWFGAFALSYIVVAMMRQLPYAKILVG